MRLWDVEHGQCVQRQQSYALSIYDVAWSPDGRRLASGSANHAQGDNGELFVWDADNGERLHAFVGCAGVVSVLTWTADGKCIICGGSDGILRWWDSEKEACFRVRKAHQGAIQSLKVCPHGNVLASCGDDNAIHIWDLERGDLLHTHRRDRPYERLNMSEVKGLTEAQKASLRMLGAIQF